ncbi:MAG: stage III sporulation protein AB [Clostridia bacterium]|nr:stage III sporulation protein AB [Clostridia bacterium]
MIKLMGMISIFIASSVMGFIMAKELNERTLCLKEIYDSVIHIKSELEYRGADVADCFRRRGRLFKTASIYLDEGMLPADALKKACGDLKELNEADRSVINAYAENLYAEDIGGQIANVNLFLENLRGCIRNSEEEYHTKNRLYKAGGTIAGMGIIILLI